MKGESKLRDTAIGNQSLDFLLSIIKNLKILFKFYNFIVYDNYLILNKLLIQELWKMKWNGFSVSNVIYGCNCQRVWIPKIFIKIGLITCTLIIVLVLWNEIFSFKKRRECGRSQDGNEEEEKKLSTVSIYI